MRVAVGYCRWLDYAVDLPGWLRCHGCSRYLAFCGSYGYLVPTHTHCGCCRTTYTRTLYMAWLLTPTFTAGSRGSCRCLVLAVWLRCRLRTRAARTRFAYTPFARYALHTPVHALPVAACYSTYALHLPRFLALFCGSLRFGCHGCCHLSAAHTVTGSMPVPAGLPHFAYLRFAALVGYCGCTVYARTRSGSCLYCGWLHTVTAFYAYIHCCVCVYLLRFARLRLRLPRLRLRTVTLRLVHTFFLPHAFARFGHTHARLVWLRLRGLRFAGCRYAAVLIPFCAYGSGSYLLFYYCIDSLPVNHHSVILLIRFCRRAFVYGSLHTTMRLPHTTVCIRYRAFGLCGFRLTHVRHTRLVTYLHRTRFTRLPFPDFTLPRLLPVVGITTRFGYMPVTGFYGLQRVAVYGSVATLPHTYARTRLPVGYLYILPYRVLPRLYTFLHTHYRTFTACGYYHWLLPFPFTYHIAARLVRCTRLVPAPHVVWLPVTGCLRYRLPVGLRRAFGYALPTRLPHGWFGYLWLRLVTFGGFTAFCLRCTAFAVTVLVRLRVTHILHRGSVQLDAARVQLRYGYLTVLPIPWITCVPVATFTRTFGFWFGLVTTALPAGYYTATVTHVYSRSLPHLCTHTATCSSATYPARFAPTQLLRLLPRLPYRGSPPVHVAATRGYVYGSRAVLVGLLRVTAVVPLHAHAARGCLWLFPHCRLPLVHTCVWFGYARYLTHTRLPHTVTMVTFTTVTVGFVDSYHCIHTPFTRVPGSGSSHYAVYFTPHAPACVYAVRSAFTCRLLYAAHLYVLFGWL